MSLVYDCEVFEHISQDDLTQATVDFRKAVHLNQKAVLVWEHMKELTVASFPATTRREHISIMVLSRKEIKITIDTNLTGFSSHAEITQAFKSWTVECIGNTLSEMWTRYHKPNKRIKK